MNIIQGGCIFALNRSVFGQILRFGSPLFGLKRRMYEIFFFFQKSVMV